MSGSAHSSRSVRKPKGEGHVRRGEILQAAERIFVAKGYEGATIRKIADEVGLSSTALYMHFTDKGEILNEICRNAFETLAEQHRTIMDSDAPSVLRLRRLVEGYIAFGLEHPNAYRLAYLTPPVETLDGAETVAQKSGAELFRSFMAAVEQAIHAGEMKGEACAVAQAIWAAAHGLVSLVITKPHFDWVDLDLLIRTQLDALFAGLVAA